MIIVTDVFSFYDKSNVQRKVCDGSGLTQYYRFEDIKTFNVFFTYIFPWLLVAGACMYSILVNLTGQCMSVDLHKDL